MTTPTAPDLAPKVQTPTPGLYPETPMDEYHRWSAASNSRLSRLLKSPAHLKAYMEEPPADTVSTRIGRAAHSAILEPDDFASRYVAGPDGDRRTKAVKDEWAALELERGPGFVLKPSEYAGCLRMRDAIHSHRSAHRMLLGVDRVELSMLWTDPATGTTCKARWDGYSPALAGGVVVDLKSTTDAAPREFERTIFKYGYHRQGAFYLEGAERHGIPARHYVIIAFEKEPPYALAVYRLTEGALEAGEQQVRGLLRRYAECVKHDRWPAYPDTVRDIALPPWAWDQIDQEMKTWETYPEHPQTPEKP